MASWIWLVAGIVLLVLEVLTPGVFVMLFMGIGSIVTGMLVLLGVLDPLWAQLGVFALVSGGALLGLRGRLVAMAQGSEAAEESLADLVGGVVFVQETIAPGARGRAEHRGSPWTVHNEGPAPLHPGDRAVVRGVDGLTLRVHHEGENP